MDENELKKLIKIGESESLEFKSSLADINEIIEDVSAFSNKTGGKIFVGISNTGKILGIKIGKDSIERLTNKIVSNTEPKIYPKILVEEIDRREIIVIEIPEAKDKPVLAFGRAFKRVGKSTIRITKDEYEKMILEKQKVYFDSLVCKEATLEDIDEEKVRWFLRKARVERNFDVDPETPVNEALERLGLIKDGRLTNAAVLLFGKNPQQFFLQSEVRCARFKGIEPVKPFIDMKVFDGNIIDQVDDALEFVLEHIPMAAWLVPGKAAREEKYEYPPEAVREAIINAICHRDYEIQSNVQVRILDDRIEVWGCGPLPEPLKIEDLKKKHRSILRNPLIGKCFFLIRFIEQWGTGTNDIIKMCLDWGLPEPIFEEIAGSLVVTLRKITDELLKKIGLNERQIRIIQYLMKNGLVTSSECQEMFNIGDRQARRDLSQLVKLGLIVQEGKGKLTKYRICPEMSGNVRKLLSKIKKTI